jgi:RNA polymerase sigma-70 factor (ECF subfamily)
MSDAVWLPAFLAGLRRGCAVARPGAETEAVAVQLASIWQRVETTHPQGAVAAVTFFAYLGEHLAAGDLLPLLEAVHAEDLYLACACAAADPRALELFERQFMPRLERALAGMRLCVADRSDVLQTLRERLLVGRRIEKYDGRGPLASWLQVCAVRIARELLGRDHLHLPLEGPAVAQLAPGVPDPEISYLKRRYGDAFRDAFREAFEAISAREQTLLRLNVVDELSIDQIAAIYHIHRATAARRLQRVRSELVRRTRELLSERFQLSSQELRSMLRLIRNITNITLRSLLGQRRASPS